MFIRVSRAVIARTQLQITRQYSSLLEGNDFTTSQIEQNLTKQPTIKVEDNPLIVKREIKHTYLFNEKITPVRQAWLEDFDVTNRKLLSLIDLHPTVFAAFPRPDIINRNVNWQRKIHEINWLQLRTRAELPDSKKKPWPQKGQGRARHSCQRTPQWVQGGWSHGPRGPMTGYTLLPFFTRVKGLMSTLSAKFAQNDIKIIDTLDNFSSDDPEVLSKCLNEREWGPSVLFIDAKDIFPQNISLASYNMTHVNLMPVYGLNVHSMLKHETLVLTMAALEEIEKKLLYQLTRTDLKEVQYKHVSPPIIPKEWPEHEGVRWATNLHEKDW